jgi:hypothetical protein
VEERLSFDSKLKCSFCPKTFKDFGPLGEHVRREHGEVPAALEQVKPPAAEPDIDDKIEKKITRLVLARIHSLNQEIKDMAKKLALPDPSTEGAEYNPWLTAEALGKTGKATLVITGNMRESSSQFGAGIIIDVKVGNSSYSWTVKFTSGNYSRLVKRFGKNPDSWKGKVNVEVKEYMGKEYVAVA